MFLPSWGPVSKKLACNTHLLSASLNCTNSTDSPGFFHFIGDYLKRFFLFCLAQQQSSPSFIECELPVVTCKWCKNHKFTEHEFFHSSSNCGCSIPFFFVHTAITGVKCCSSNSVYKLLLWSKVLLRIKGTLVKWGYCSLVGVLWLVQM